MLGSDLKHIDDIRKAGFRPQVVGCFIKDHKILFVYKKKHDLWQLPQGGIDNNETIDQAFWREFSEELGTNFMSGCEKNIRMIGSDEAKFNIKNLRELNSDAGKKLQMKGKKYFFIAANTNATGLHREESEFDDYRWVTLAQAQDLVEHIGQKRKQKQTEKALNLVSKKGFIN